MKWIAESTASQNTHCVIEKQKLTSLTPGVPDQFGYYLYVYKNGKGTHDYLQDTLEIAMDQAFEEFGVPKQAWRQVES